METVHFKITINAPVEKVWDTMLEDKSYREWTSPFHQGSFFDGSWEEGSKILFLGPGEDGKLGGMVSRIKENRKYEFVSIEHLGVILDGVEDTNNEWSGALENYTFRSVDGKTELIIDLDVTEDDKEMMGDSWPKALEKLKEISERE